MRSVVGVAALLGMLGGLFSSLVLTATGQPLLEDALVIEESRRDPDAPVLDELVSRDVQRGIGRFGAYALAGAAFGVFFAVAFVALRRRVPDPFRRALVTGGAGRGGHGVALVEIPPQPAGGRRP